MGVLSYSNEFFSERYKLANKLVKENKNYRKTVKIFKNHKFEFFNYILPDFKDLKENNSYFMRGYCVIDEKIESLGIFKFFNLNENSDSTLGVHDELENFYISPKLDGTLIIPYKLDGKLRFRTKNTVDSIYVDEAERLFDENIILEVLNKLNSGENMFFELISPLDKHIVQYNEYGLKEIAYSKDGKLLPKNIIKNYFKNVQELIDFTENQENIEGYVLYDKFSNKILKLKNSEYFAKHKIKENFSLNYVLLHLILEEKIDDCLSLLNNEEIKYIQYLTKELVNVINIIINYYKLTFDYNRKDFALKYKNISDFCIVMKYFQFNIGEEDLINNIKKYLINFYNSCNKCDILFKNYNIKNFSEFVCG